jgi:CheY-like chemotaxis protein
MRLFLYKDSTQIFEAMELEIRGQVKRSSILTIMKAQRTVLVAEDDANDVFLLRRAFECAEVHLNVAHVANGREAADYLAGVGPYSDRMRYPVPELLVTDLNMPLMGGLELLSWLRGQPQLNWLPAAVLSSSGLEADRATSLDLGARAYHVKPVDFSVLVALVRELGRQFLGVHREAGGVFAPAPANSNVRLGDAL